jgi:hypothetical protein
MAVALFISLMQWLVQGRAGAAGKATPGQVFELVKTRRSVFPKDMTGKKTAK